MADDGIVWMIQTDGACSSGPAILHAYNATNVAQELYNSSQFLARDNPGSAVKMIRADIADGKVFVGAQDAVSIFGNGVFLPAPAIAPNGGNFNNRSFVTLADAAAGRGHLLHAGRHRADHPFHSTTGRPHLDELA